MIISQEFTKIRKASTASKTLIVSLKEDIIKASGLKLDDKVYTCVEEIDGKKRIIIEGVEK